ANNAIRRVDPVTGAVTTWAGGGEVDAVDGSVAVARFANPTGTTCDAGALYVTDAWSDSLRRIDFATEVVSTVAGTFWRAEDHDDVLSLAAMNAPVGVRIVGGKLVIVNPSNVRVIH